VGATVARPVSRVPVLHSARHGQPILRPALTHSQTLAHSHTHTSTTALGAYQTWCLCDWTNFRRDTVSSPDTVWYNSAHFRGVLNNLQGGSELSYLVTNIAVRAHEDDTIPGIPTVSLLQLTHTFFYWLCFLPLRQGARHHGGRRGLSLVVGRDGGDAQAGATAT